MSVRQHEFEREIIAHPEDDEPRLIYADWLEENGDPRGEFIRVQCELARLAADDPRRPGLEGRELLLVRSHSKGWGAAVRPWAPSWWFHRGMIAGVKLDAETFLERGDELLEAAPISHVQFARALRHLESLGQSRLLAKLQGISFDANWLGNGGVAKKRFSWSEQQTRGWRNYQAASADQQERVASAQAAFAAQLSGFLESPYLQSVRDWSFQDNYLGEPGMRSLAAARNMHSTERLNLDRNMLDAKALALLADSPHFNGLRHLTLGSCRNFRTNYDEDQVGPLTPVVGRLIGRLETANLGSCGVSLAGINELSLREPPKRLRSLSLERSMLWENHWDETRILRIDVLWASHLLHQLHTLNLGSCYLDAERITTLVNLNGMESICNLGVANNQYGHQGGKLLAESKLLSRLARLDLSGGDSATYTDSEAGGKLTDTGVAHLAAAGNLASLAVLAVRRNDLTHQSARSIVNSGFLEQLHSLDLSGNKLGNEGATVLCARGPWQNLAWLNLRKNGIGIRAKQKLLAEFGPRVVF